MDNERKSALTPEDEQWLNELLGRAPAKESIEADPAVDAASDLIHPEDLELERILREHREEVDAAQDTTDAAPETNAPLFDDVMVQSQPEDAPASPPEAVAPEKDPPKKKRDRYGLIRLSITLVCLALILLIGSFLGKKLWSACSDLMAFGKPEKIAVITITEDDDIDSITKKLSDAKLIENPKLFKFFATATDKDERITPGTYELSSQLDYNAMINAMTTYTAARKEVDIMFPEGYTCAQIFALLEEKGVCTVKELEEYAATGELGDYWFLEGVNRGDKYCLEGYLFPDTHRFYENDSPRHVIEKFLDAFDYRFTNSMREKFEVMKTRYAKMLASHGYSQDYINSHPLTIRQVVIIASMIEKETSGANESYDISSVIYNRLTNQSSYPFLNIDATLVYALGGKSELTEADKQLDSPYNTYKYPGIIPGPISNPGRNSLDAALDPNDTNYYFYALNPNTNKHHFTRTYSEHLAFLNSIG